MHNQPNLNILQYTSFLNKDLGKSGALYAVRRQVFYSLCYNVSILFLTVKSFHVDLVKRFVFIPYKSWLCFCPTKLFDLPADLLSKLTGYSGTKIRSILDLEDINITVLYNKSINM